MSNELESFDILQDEVGEWARENFGTEMNETYPLLGAAEEIGEVADQYRGDGRIGLAIDLMGLAGDLCHSILKRAQGIRLDDDDVGPVAEQEAIFLLRSTLDALGSEEETGSADLVGIREEVVDGVGDTTIYLSDFCERGGYSYRYAVEDAWYDEVSTREWVADVSTETSEARSTSSEKTDEDADVSVGEADV